MLLRQYLFNHSIKTKDFAKQIGFQKTYLSAICNKRIKCGKKLAHIIEKATNGEVTAKELLSIKPEKKKDKQLYLINENEQEKKENNNS